MSLPDPTGEKLARELVLLREAQAHIPNPKPGGDRGGLIKRTLVLWVLFILAFVAVWQLVGPSGETPSLPAP